MKCIVKGRTVGPDGKVHGTYDENPYVNTVLYDVEFPDGQVKEYSANLIAENTLSQVDEDGYNTSLMEAIVDFKKDEATAVSMQDKCVVSKGSNQRRLRRTRRMAQNRGCLWRI